MNKSVLLSLSLVSFLPLASYADQNLAGNVTVTGGSTTGNLNVTGSLDVDGPVVSFGTIGTSTVGNSLIFSDSTATSGTTGDTLTFSANRTSASWLWLHNASKSAMRLNSLHQLLLYQADGSTAGITLTPVSNQISFGSATLTGSGANLTAGGALTVTGALTASSGITNTNGTLTGGTTGLSLNAGGTNQNITLTPSGAGNTILNGNVGIATTTPLRKLQLGGDVFGLGFEAAGTSPNSGVLRFGDHTGWKFHIGRSRESSGGSLNSGIVGALVTFQDNGNVGIGTTMPGAELDIAVPAGGADGIQISRPSSPTWQLMNYGQFYIQEAGLGPRLVVAPGGNVGIGTTGPTTALQVMGPITAGSTASTLGTDYLYGYYGYGKLFVLGSQYSSGASFLGYGVKAQPGAIGYLSSTNISAPRTAIEANAGYVAFLTGESQTSTDGGAVTISERVRIDQNGNVGIGTINPSSLLYVRRSSVSNPGFNPVIGLGYDDVETFGGSLGLRVASSNPRQGLKISSNLNFTFHSPVATSNPAFQWQTGTVTDDSVDNNTVMTITGAGNVGIGTTNPSYKLQVEGASNGLIFRAHSQGDFIYALAGDGVAGTNLDLFSIRNNNTGVVHLNTVNGARLALGASNAAAAGTIVETLTITPSGNVGIGTTNPTQKLSVAGTIRAYAVVVDTGWSDYVFDKNYRLAPLSEVEQHIKADKHLPGIPSAAEVAEHGVSLGDMQSKLLAKVEELTLHLIAQEKEITALRQQVSELKAASNHP